MPFAVCCRLLPFDLPFCRMKPYRYQLVDYRDRPSPKYNTCPECGQRTFIPYVDTETGEVLGSEYGKCERVIECKHVNYPGRQTTVKSLVEAKPQRPPGPDRIAPELVNIAINRDITTNQLAVGLVNCGIPLERLKAVFAKYRVGTWPDGRCVFWMHDQEGIARSGKVIKYKPDAHRDKSTNPTWVHTLLEIKDYDLVAAMFGAHLIEPGKTVAIVESEKTALIMAAVFGAKHPDKIWVAVGSLQNFTPGAKKRLWPLFKAEVELYPDLNGIEAWAANLEAIRDDLKLVSPRVADWRAEFPPEVADLVEDIERSDVADWVLAYIKLRRS